MLKLLSIQIYHIKIGTTWTTIISKYAAIIRLNIWMLQNLSTYSLPRVYTTNSPKYLHTTNLSPGIIIPDCSKNYFLIKDPWKIAFVTGNHNLKTITSISSLPIFTMIASGSNKP